MASRRERPSLRRTARAATAPIRNYLNDHFEMVKQEVRQHQPSSQGGPGSSDRLLELEATISETGLHQARLLAQLRDESATLHERLGELERIVARLADVVAASTIADDHA